MSRNLFFLIAFSFEYQYKEYVDLLKMTTYSYFLFKDFSRSFLMESPFHFLREASNNVVEYEEEEALQEKQSDIFSSPSDLCFA